jgi:hypothetical protein
MPTSKGASNYQHPMRPLQMTPASVSQDPVPALQIDLLQSAVCPNMCSALFALPAAWCLSQGRVLLHDTQHV